MNLVIRTTVMLPEETHERLRRIAHLRGVPLAKVIRQALTDAAWSAPETTLSFIGAVDVETGFHAAESAGTLPPITPPVGDATEEELEALRRRADEGARRCGAAL